MHPLQFLWHLVKGKWVVPKDTRPDMTGKTVIVTGANSGLGFEAAVKFVELGAEKVILAVRTLSKGEDAARKIIDRTGCKGVVEVWQLDMMDYSSIKAFATRAQTQLERVDIAVLNAGVSKQNFTASQYGWEETLQVNVISTTYLALLLLPKLKASKTPSHTPVLEIVGSGSQYMVKSLKSETSPLAAYNDKAGYNGMLQYAVSKLFVMYVEHHIAELMNSSSGGPADAHVTVVCPGATKSDLARDANDMFFMKMLINVFAFLLQKTTEEGAREYISGVDLGEKGHGKFWTEDHISHPAPMMEGEKGKTIRDSLWEEVLVALEKDVPDVRALAKKA